MAKPNNEDAVKMQRRMMETAGSWPQENSSIWYKSKGIFHYFLSLCLSTTMLIEAYSFISNFAKLSEILYILITILAYNFKHAGFFANRKAFIRGITLLNCQLFHLYPDDFNSSMEKSINRLQMLANFYRYCVLGCIFFMCTSSFFEKQPLLFPFPYDLGNYRYCMYFFQSYTLTLVGWNNLSLDSLCACLIGTAATQLEILEKKLIGIRDLYATQTQSSFATTDDVLIENLKECITHHTAIIEYVESIDKVFSIGILSQFLGSIIIICNTLFHFILVSVGSAQFYLLLIYLAIMLFELFMYCWFGNDVLWKSVKIGEACYLSKWEECGVTISKYLFIIMERSKRPLKITAFKFSIVSLAAYSSIIQWSYSYFALLMKLYKKQKLE